MIIVTCHQCQIRGNAKVSIVEKGFIVKCKCGNKGINVMKTPEKAVGSWGSGHQQWDREPHHNIHCRQVFGQDTYCDCGLTCG